MKRIALLGATGSIGTQALDVVRNNQELFKIVSMSFGNNVELGASLINEFKPEIVAVATEQVAKELKEKISSSITLLYGQDGLIQVAIHPEADCLLNAVMGRVGLEPTIHAIRKGKQIALANKETLVTAGHIIMQEARKYSVDILPVDSEHSAIFQCLQGEKKEELSKIIITASGGSFRDLTRNDLKNVTVEQALNHPNWSMGSKITIDSATMMNKGLEVIEARWLFDIDYSRIETVLHKQSIVHSMVEFQDTSIIAHLGTPDMRIPISYALTYPSRIPLQKGKGLSFSELLQLEFKPMDYDRYRALALAISAGKQGGNMPTVLNAANEIAVDAFLKGKIGFLDIDTIVESALMSANFIADPDLPTILHEDESTRKHVTNYITQRW